MAKLRIVNAKGETMSYQGKLMVFDLDKPEARVEQHGFDERGRAETLLWMFNRNRDTKVHPELFRLEEFE